MRYLLAVISLLLLAGLPVGYAVYLRLGGEGLVAWGNYLTGLGTLFLGFAAAYAGIRAVEEYRARTRTEKARWTTELYHRFYEEGHAYRLIRQKIDYDDLEDILALIRKGEDEFSQEERDLFDKFTDYLNFFEYMAYLLEGKQLDASDVQAMFDYYLRRMAQLKNSKELNDYIRNSGFERFHALLLDYGLKP